MQKRSRGSCLFLDQLNKQQQYVYLHRQRKCLWPAHTRLIAVNKTHSVSCQHLLQTKGGQRAGKDFPSVEELDTFIAASCSLLDRRREMNISSKREQERNLAGVWFSGQGKALQSSYYYYTQTMEEEEETQFNNLERKKHCSLYS